MIRILALLLLVSVSLHARSLRVKYKVDVPVKTISWNSTAEFVEGQRGLGDTFPFIAFGESELTPKTFKNALAGKITTAQAAIDRIIYEELCRDQILPESREMLRAVISRLAARGADAVILGCTELPLLLDESEWSSSIRLRYVSASTWSKPTATQSWLSHPHPRRVGFPDATAFPSSLLDSQPPL